MANHTDCIHEMREGTCAFCLGTADSINGSFLEGPGVVVVPSGGWPDHEARLAKPSLAEERKARVQKAIVQGDAAPIRRSTFIPEIGQNSAPNGEQWRPSAAAPRLQGRRVLTYRNVGRPSWLPVNYWIFDGLATTDDGTTGEWLGAGFNVSTPAAEQASDEMLTPEYFPEIARSIPACYSHSVLAAGGDIDELRERLGEWRRTTGRYLPAA